MRPCKVTILILLSLLVNLSQAQQTKIDSSLFLLQTISGKISPKSVVHNGNGIFYAQNMMYRHTITAYNRSFDLIKTIKDQVSLSDFGENRYTAKVKGGPVECDFSHNGKYAWVSNYSMSGGGDGFFLNPGCDNCSSSSKYDSSYVYQIDVTTHQIINAVKVGSVPKYVACAPDDKKVVVSNWSSGDVSIIDVDKKKEVKRIKVGTFPRGIVIDSKSEFAYVTVMGSTKIAKINLNDYTHTFLENVGKGPRHLCISPDDKWLYLTLNSENKVAKINTSTFDIQKLKVGHQPRSMTISDDGKYLFIVHYNDATFSKVSTEKLKIEAISDTKSKPIGITYDAKTKNIWVACYSGHIQIFKDSTIKSKKIFDVDSESENGVLTLNNNGASVATLEVSKDTVSPESDNAESDAVAIVVKEERTFKPIRKLYDVKLKHFDMEKFKKPEVAVVETNIIIEPKTASSVANLDENAPCLVIVGGFSEAANAQKKIKQLEKLKIPAAQFYNSSKGLNYVFVYSCNTKDQATEWLKGLPNDISSWIMVK